MVNAKNHESGSVWVAGEFFRINNQDFPHIPKSRAEAQAVEWILRQATGRVLQVRGIVVVARARQLSIKSQPRDGVQVLAVQDLVPWLKSQRRVVDDRFVQDVYDRARNPATWAR